jgi:hypothetical protein
MQFIVSISASTLTRVSHVVLAPFPQCRHRGRKCSSLVVYTRAHRCIRPSRWSPCLQADSRGGRCRGCCRMGDRTRGHTNDMILDAMVLSMILVSGYRWHDFINHNTTLVRQYRYASSGLVVSTVEGGLFNPQRHNDQHIVNTTVTYGKCGLPIREFSENVCCCACIKSIPQLLWVCITTSKRTPSPAITIRYPSSRKNHSIPPDTLVVTLPSINLPKCFLSQCLQRYPKISKRLSKCGRSLIVAFQPHMAQLSSCTSIPLSLYEGAFMCSCPY